MLHEETVASTMSAWPDDKTSCKYSIFDMGIKLLNIPQRLKMYLNN